MSMAYMTWLHSVADQAVSLITSKTRTYGDSWKRRGGRGAWFTLVRPWDRLERIVEAHGGDVLAACRADTSGDDGTALACVRDVMCYLILVAAEIEAEQFGELPLLKKIPEEQSHAAEQDRKTGLLDVALANWVEEPNSQANQQILMAIAREHLGL